MHESEKWKGSRSVVSDSSRPHGLQPTRLLHPWDLPGKSTGVGCHCQHIYGCYFCVHSVSLCLLVGAFNPFTFKLIIDIDVPIAIFLIVWGWFRRFFSSLVFLDYISPFNICCKAALVVLNSLNFCLSEKLLISPSILNEILSGYSNLGCRLFPFSTLNISCHSLWPEEFLLKDQL